MPEGSYDTLAPADEPTAPSAQVVSPAQNGQSNPNAPKVGHVSMYMYVCVCAYIVMYVYVCMYEYVCICMYVFVYVIYRIAEMFGNGEVWKIWLIVCDFVICQTYTIQIFHQQFCQLLLIRQFAKH